MGELVDERVEAQHTHAHGVGHAGKTQAVCRCDVFAVQADGTEKLCAVAQGTIAALGGGAKGGAGD